MTIQQGTCTRCGHPFAECNGLFACDRNIARDRALTSQLPESRKAPVRKLAMQMTHQPMQVLTIDASKLSGGRRTHQALAIEASDVGLKPGNFPNAVDVVKNGITRRFAFLRYRRVTCGPKAGDLLAVDYLHDGWTLSLLND